MTEFDQRLAATEDRLDRISRVNEHIVAGLDRTGSTIRRIDERPSRFDDIIARIVDRQNELADGADLLDRGLGTLIREFVAHRADGQGAA